MLDPENHAQYGHQPSPILSLIFSYFVAILLLFFIQHSYTFHIWKCALDPEHNAQHGHQPSPIFSPFFLIFSLFYCYFSFSIATLSIFGSVHWTLKTQCSIWSPTIPHFFPYFFLIFSLFYCYFSLSIATLSIFGSAH